MSYRRNLISALVLAGLFLSCDEKQTTAPPPTYEVTGTITGWLCNPSNNDFFSTVGENPLLEVYNAEGTKVYEGAADSGVFACALEADSAIFVITTHYTWPPDTFIVPISADTSLHFNIRSQAEERDNMIFYLGASPLPVPQELELLHTFGGVLGDTVLQLAQATESWRKERILGQGALRQVTYTVPLVNLETGNIIKAAEEAQRILAADTAGMFGVIQSIHIEGIVFCDF